MTINYGVNRRLPAVGKRRRRIEHKNGRLEVEGNWADPTFHESIRTAILQRHKGWSITGYAQETSGTD